MALRDLIQHLIDTPVEDINPPEHYAKLHRIAQDTAELLVELAICNSAQIPTWQCEIVDMRARLVKLEQDVTRLVNLSNGIEDA